MTKNKDLTARVTILVTPECKAQLDAMVKASGVPLCEIGRRALAAYLTSKAKGTK